MSEIIGKVLGFVFSLGVLLALFTLPTMWLWNWLMPYIFGLPTINVWQSFGLLLLTGLLFKNVSTNK
jgi:hypothetical protein